MDRENWMRNYQFCSMLELTIPGTHNSFAYSLITNGPNDSGVPKMFNFIVKQWAKTQDISILNQLCLGVRYFDLRVCKYNDTYYTLHSLMAIPLDNVLQSIIEFICIYPTERIIIDINHIYVDDYDALKQFLLERLHKFLVPNDYINLATPIINLNKNIFLFYRDGDTLIFSQDSINSMWHDTNKVKELTQRISDEVIVRNKINVSQCLLTPRESDIVKGILLFVFCPSSLKSLTRRHKKSMMKCLNSCAMDKNVIIMDFVDEELIDICLNVNKSKFG